MKKIELLKSNRSLLEIMSRNAMKATDVEFVDVYDDFIELRKGMKFSAVITELSIKYSKSERTISRMIAKLQEDTII